MADHGRISLVLGGARSGKSTFAQARAEATGLKLVYVATCQALDDEMADRITRHQAERDARWRTVEAPTELAATLRREARPDTTLMVDCLTLWLSNVMLSGVDVEAAQAELLSALEGAPGPIFLVTNEVGLGIVPDNALARAFRDAAGRLNQAVASVADNVSFIAAGLPLRLK